jgi:chromosome segregation ATPase
MSLDPTALRKLCEILAPLHDAAKDAERLQAVEAELAAATKKLEGVKAQAKAVETASFSKAAEAAKELADVKTEAANIQALAQLEAQGLLKAAREEIDADQAKAAKDAKDKFDAATAKIAGLKEEIAELDKMSNDAADRLAGFEKALADKRSDLLKLAKG